MKDHSEKIRLKDQPTDSSHVEHFEEGLETMTGMEKVKEMTQGKAGEDLPANTSHSKGDGSTKKEEALTDQMLLRERLLKQAPKEHQMKKELESLLKKDIKVLEVQIKKHQRKRDYHGLSMAIMKLREVLRELQELARMSYEKMKTLWLKIVHQLS